MPTATQSGRLAGPVERLLVELSLSVLIVLAHFTADSRRNLPAFLTTKPAAVLAAAYASATLVHVSKEFP